MSTFRPKLFQLNHTPLYRQEHWFELESDTLSYRRRYSRRYQDECEMVVEIIKSLSSETVISLPDILKFAPLLWNCELVIHYKPVQEPYTVTVLNTSFNRYFISLLKIVITGTGTDNDLIYQLKNCMYYAVTSFQKIKVKSSDSQITQALITTGERFLKTYECQTLKAKYMNDISERLHILYPESNKEYRQNLLNIVNTITQNQVQKTDVVLDDDPCKSYNLFVFDNPFKEIDEFKNIKKLKIYHRHTEDAPDAYVIASDIQNSWNPEELPLFKMTNRIVDVMSIVIECNGFDTSRIYASISHELVHALTLIKNKSQAYKTEADNTISREFDHWYNIATVYDHRVTPYGYPMHEIIGWLSELAYFCQTTEIEAHLDSAWAEYQKAKPDQKTVLDIIRHPYDFSFDELAEQLPVLYTYAHYYTKVQDLLEKNALTKFQEIYKDDIADILDILHKAKQYEHKSFEEILMYWKNIILEFLQKLGSIILNPTDPKHTKFINSLSRYKSKKF